MPSISQQPATASLPACQPAGNSKNGQNERMKIQFQEQSNSVYESAATFAGDSAFFFPQSLQLVFLFSTTPNGTSQELRGFRLGGSRYFSAAHLCKAWMFVGFGFPAY